MEWTARIAFFVAVIVAAIFARGILTSLFSRFHSFYRAKRKAGRRKKRRPKLTLPRAGAEIYVSRPVAVAIWLFLATLLSIGFWMAGERLVSWVEGQLPLTIDPKEKDIALQLIRWGVRGLGIVLLAIWLFWGCLKRVGRADRPAQGVIARLGHPVDAVGPGGLVFILGPFPEELWLLPTGQYEFEYERDEGLFSKEEKGKKLASQPLDLGVTLYLRWPRPDREYTWPVLKKEADFYPKPDIVPPAPPPEGYKWRRVPGKVLLGRLFLRFPRNLSLWDGADPERGIGPFLEEAIIGALRQALANKDHLQYRAEKQDIENYMKYYLIREPGNPLREWGIPPDCLDIELTATGFREAKNETEKAFIAPELAERHAEAANPQRRQIQELLAGYQAGGVSPDIAAVLASGRARGEGDVDLGVLRDLAIVRFLSQGESPPRRPRKRRS